MEAGGMSVPVLLLVYYVLCCTRSAAGMCLKAFLVARAEREQRATVIAMAAALPQPVSRKDSRSGCSASTPSRATG
ncbi:hypothetical protein AB852_25890 [Streptomyces uncialis]|uniref:Uncharacterized protein n=1 Tax=Streptomyces uncialis TaxID=1048205 RepID=A0A1Q4V388_9ACTN|nr:hypothetical protein AB852_25890 [Streptomyces uncialis]